ncbi:MAG: UbiA family prenyltransferase [Acidobacteria bacterium]|nr:UbiA family prenyltransferase [Acidobacteriota bacterium]
MKFKLYWTFVRPFTLLLPSVGMVTGALMALGAPPRMHSDWSTSAGGILRDVALGALMAAALNAASNALNQLYDIEVDRINKPGRLLPAGILSVREASVLALALFAAAFVLAWLVNPECFILVLTAAVLTFMYSAPPYRTKSHPFASNITVAIPRGVLLVVAGWSTVKTLAVPEPWILGAMFGLYLLGAITTKDFSDVKGDAAHGCMTLPVRYGIRSSAYMIAPFFVLPFLLLDLGAHRGWLSANKNLLYALGLALPLWGAYIAYLIIRDPDELGRVENHVSWKHMYLLTIFAQVGIAASYLL